MHMYNIYRYRYTDCQLTIDEREKGQAGYLQRETHSQSEMETQAQWKSRKMTDGYNRQ